MAHTEYRIKQLEAKVEQLQPRKRRKVQASPNSKFVNIQAIKQAQIDTGDREIEELPSDISILSTDIEDYIEVQDLLSD